MNLSVGSIVEIVVGIVFLVIVLGVVGGSFFTVEQASAAIVQRFGQFSRVATAGLNLKTPFIESVAHVVSLKVQQFDTNVEAKTKDGTFVAMPISIQYKILPARVKEAYYNIANPVSQITSLVYNVVLGHVPSLSLDEVYAQQSSIGSDITKSVNDQMEDYGYEVVKTLIKDVVPSAEVKESMNQVQAALRNQQAATAQGEANRIALVAKATAEKQSKILQGEGIAGERQAIIEGLKKSVEDLAAATGIDAQEAMSMVVLTQYFDALSKIAGSNNSNTILLPHSPTAVPDFLSEIRNAIAVGNVMSRAASPEAKSQKAAAGS
jgi:regulator of protease activity HflC (stomatin/prohibitin superfamily)